MLSDGSFVNGSELTKGMNFAVDNNVLITENLDKSKNYLRMITLLYLYITKKGGVLLL